MTATSIKENLIAQIERRKNHKPMASSVPQPLYEIAEGG